MTWSEFNGRALYLDSNIVIFAVERGSRWTDALRELFKAVDDDAVRVFTSEVTLAEVLVKPFQAGAGDVAERYEALLGESSPVTVTKIDRPILRTAARVQGSLGVKLIDAIHVATAIECNCDLFLSNDIRLGRKLEQPQWLSLDEVGAERG